ncbi:MAG: STAS/SEC14 domain-containing protein [Alphaproteobacteria bacterium]|nr:STAS/SEC14 domain-containing protein [Alphaproteobacteria bacterium]MBU0798147.1 STAS/SEC14 domain-containing protein [Alphaproteobacteria bacterium]MBU0887036.1 STAS/SEC14 domain-containing protein [Alphaproteobacteria bacterium]MBU1814286.1 STAS/SEC14 domain-containing protein [Alphaproteobacteria bacterium]MBU2091701.1 STAS/SEC14 domain-containing protein [Alphaproteobacteria bacterium]
MPFPPDRFLEFGATAQSVNFECASGGAYGRVKLAINRGILWLTIEDDASGDDLLACFQQALASGHLPPTIPTLVDLTGFTGHVEWPAIHRIRNLAPWGTGKDARSQVAYVSRDSFFRFMLKIVAVLFPLTQHRLFDDRDSALHWLAPPKA